MDRLFVCLALLTTFLFACVGQSAGAEGEKSAAEAAASSGVGAEMVQVFGAGESSAGSQAPGLQGTGGGRGPSALSLVARTGFWLGLVIVTLCGVVAVGRKLLSRPMGMLRSPAVETLGRSYLDAKRCVYLLKVGARVLVVGASDSGLSCLSEVCDQAEVARLVAAARSGAGGAGTERGGFGSVLARRVSGLVYSRAAGSADLDLDAEADPTSGCGMEEPGAEAARAVQAVHGGGDFSELRARVEGLKARLRAIS